MYKTNWDLEKYFGYTGLNDAKIDEDIAKILPAAKKFVEKYKGNIKTITTPTQIIEFYNDNDVFDKLIEKPYYFLHYLEALDTQDQAIAKKLGEMQVLWVQIGEMMLFVSQEFKELGEDKLRELAEHPDMKPYKNALVEQANNLKYILDEKQEFTINKLSRTLATAGNLQEELRNSFVYTIEGKDGTFTEEEVRTMMRSPDRETRRKASESLNRSYELKQTQISLGHTYSGIVKKSIANMQLRGYTDVMAQRNVSEEMDTEVVNKLIEMVQKHYGLFQRYVKAKQKHMGYSEMKGYDIAAPISKIEKKYSFEEGCEMYLKLTQGFDEEFYEYGKDMLENGRVDAFPVAGKRGGAFASYDSGSPSFVLLNYTDTLYDVSTLAHELGHATHGHLSQVQKSQVYSSPLSLAETASIFNELLLVDHIEKDLSEDEKIEFLNQRLGDIMATTFRQIQYIAFEKRVHEAIANGEELTYEDFNKMWMEEMKKMSGDTVEYDGDTSVRWSRIPHIFHTPFYCYTYAFGMIVSFSLMNLYKTQPEGFQEKYKDILRAGGSERPRDLLMRHGIDIASDEFYLGAFAQMEKILEEFEK